VWGIHSVALRVSALVATGMFLLYSALVGALLSGIFVVYQLGSIASVFTISAGIFGGMSIYGYVTKRDLTSMGSILVAAFWGLLLASVVNIFWANSTLYWIISYVGVAIFIGLIAYDTQRLKAMAYQTQGNPDLAARYAIIGSLTLYLDFINLFMFMLRILGNRR
jgi:uncharacterized protein